MKGMSDMKKMFCMLPALLAAMIFAGCHSLNEGITVRRNIPENTEIHVLIKDDSDVSPLQTTELSQYREDGFICADMCLANAEISGDKFVFSADHSDSKTFINYVKKYSEIRIALTDGQGNILKVSETYSLILPHKNYCWKAVSYDSETNSITGIEAVSLDNTHFNSMLKWTALSFAAMLIMAFLCKILLVKNKLFPAVWAVCSIPTAVMAFFQYEEFFTEFYNYPSVSPGSAAISMAVCLLPWLCLSILGWVNFLKAKKTYR